MHRKSRRILGLFPVSAPGTDACRTIGLVLGMTLSAAAQPAQAQTASNLVCKGCVGKGDLGKKAVVTAKIGDGAVTAPKIGDNAVTSAKILDGAILPADLHATARPARVSASQEVNEGGTGLTQNVATTIRQAVVAAPAAGAVTAFFSAVTGFGGTGTARVSCWAARTQTPAYDFSVPTCVTSGVDGEYQTCSGATTFPVQAGNVTVFLRCQETVSEITIWDNTLTLLYTPGPGQIVIADAPAEAPSAR